MVSRGENRWRACTETEKLKQKGKGWGGGRGMVTGEGRSASRNPINNLAVSRLLKNIHSAVWPS